MASKLFIVFLFSLIAYGAVAQISPDRSRSRSSRSIDRPYRRAEREQAQQCRLQRLTSSQPTQRFECEGGAVEIWDPQEDQFQCAGLAAFRAVIRANSLALPKFFPAPRLIYIEQGRGVLGVTFPGCPETFHTDQSARRSQSQAGARNDQHQKLHRVRQGDIIAVPAGAVSWCYNDGGEDLISVSVLDLNNQENQLDNEFLRAFMLAGSLSQREQEILQRSRQESEETRRSRRYRASTETFQNIFRGFDQELLAEAFNISPELVRRMQESNNQGLIVRCQEEIRFEVEEEEEGYRSPYELNGVEEAFCNMRIRQNIDIRRHADVHARQAGRISIVNQQKLPILQYIDMSAERGHLLPNALYTPHWSITDNRALYALRGELDVQVVDDNGNTIMNERVREGDMFVLPQFYASIARAGNEGFEWVTFKTSSQTMKSPMAGYTSVMRAMPIDVLANAFQVSPREAQQLKMNRDPQSMLLSPTRRSTIA